MTTDGFADCTARAATRAAAALREALWELCTLGPRDTCGLIGIGGLQTVAPARLEVERSLGALGQVRAGVAARCAGPATATEAAGHRITKAGQYAVELFGGGVDGAVPAARVGLEARHFTGDHAVASIAAAGVVASRTAWFVAETPADVDTFAVNHALPLNGIVVVAAFLGAGFDVEQARSAGGEVTADVVAVDDGARIIGSSGKTRRQRCAIAGDDTREGLGPRALAASGLARGEIEIGQIAAGHVGARIGASRPLAGLDVVARRRRREASVGRVAGGVDDAAKLFGAAAPLAVRLARLGVEAGNIAARQVRAGISASRRVGISFGGEALG